MTGYQTLYEPINKQKCRGTWFKETDKILLKSQLELKFAKKYCDGNPNCLLWQYEGFPIPYFNTQDMKWHKYYPDFIMKVFNPERNRNENYIVEIKPFAQTPATKRITKGNKNMISLNKNKWDAANAWAKQHQFKFVVKTEKTI